MKETPDLNDAYSLSSNDEIVELYKKWSHSYDAGFGGAQGYQLPNIVAAAFVAFGGRGPVLDVGAGTGLVAEHLSRLGTFEIDGLDLSQPMLDVASMKNVYRSTIAADVTIPLSRDELYNGIVSAGTFTFGHVGPAAIQNLLDIATSGAVFILSVNAMHFDASGFAKEMSKYASQISELEYRDVRIYDDRADAPHRQDLAKLVSFKKV